MALQRPKSFRGFRETGPKYENAGLGQIRARAKKKMDEQGVVGIARFVALVLVCTGPECGKSAYATRRLLDGCQFKIVLF